MWGEAAMGKTDQFTSIPNNLQLISVRGRNYE